MSQPQTTGHTAPATVRWPRECAPAPLPHAMRCHHSRAIDDLVHMTALTEAFSRSTNHDKRVYRNLYTKRFTMVRYRELIMLGSSLATLRSYPEHVRYSFGTIARYVCESERTQLYEAIQEAIPMQQEMKFVKNWPPVKFSEKNFPPRTSCCFKTVVILVFISYSNVVLGVVNEEYP